METVVNMSDKPVCFDRSSSGTEFMCCSWDGTVAYFDLTIEEIGKPMSSEEKVLFVSWPFSIFVVL
jgi:hypothetical protein